MVLCVGTHSAISAPDHERSRIAEHPKMSETTRQFATGATRMLARQAIGTAIGGAAGKIIQGTAVGAAIGVLLTPTRLSCDTGEVCKK